MADTAKTKSNKPLATLAIVMANLLTVALYFAVGHGYCYPMGYLAATLTVLAALVLFVGGVAWKRLPWMILPIVLLAFALTDLPRAMALNRFWATTGVCSPSI